MRTLDYHGRLAPAYVTRAINSRAGYNLYGNPKYRLVWAQHRLTPSGGVWLDWDKSLTTSERNEDKNSPIRRMVDVRLVPRYGPLHGWVLEKWVPPYAYGSPKQWYSPAVIGGTMLWVPWANRYIPSQGEFPNHGDYEFAGYHFPTDADLSESLILTAVGRIEHYLDELPATPLGRTLRRVYIAKQAEEAADKAFDKYAYDMMDDATPAFNGATMFGAGEKRPSYKSQVARRLGITSHVE